MNDRPPSSRHRIDPAKLKGTKRYRSNESARTNGMIARLKRDWTHLSPSRRTAIGAACGVGFAAVVIVLLTRPDPLSDDRRAEAAKMALATRIPGKFRRPTQVLSATMARGTAVGVDGQAYYWVKGISVYAGNGVAMTWSPNIRVAPAGVGPQELTEALSDPSTTIEVKGLR